MAPMANDNEPASRHPRRQPNPVRTLRRRLRQRLQPGHVHRRARRADRPLRPGGREARRGDRRRGAQAQPRLQPDARVRAGQLAVVLHPRLRHPAGVRHRSAGHHRRRRRDRRRALSTSAAAGGVDTASDAPIAFGDDLRRVLLGLRRSKSNVDRLKLVGKLPAALGVEIPVNSEPRTGLSMGEHAGDHRQGDGHQARRPGRAGRGQPQQHGGRLRPRLLRRPGHPVPRRVPGQQPARRFVGGEAGQAQAGVRREVRRRDDDGGQLHAADRRRVGVAAGHRRVGRGPRAAGAGLLTSTARPPRWTT